MNDITTFVTKIPGSKFYTASFYKNYLHALSLYSNRKKKEMGDFIAKVIAEQCEHEHILLFYRLWLESAATDKDRVTLHMLKNHVGNMAHLYDDYDQWVALRGLVHFELEELDGCTLLLRGLEGNDYNPYALELSQRFAMRTTPDRQVKEILFNSKAPVIDYFTIQTAAQVLLSNGKMDALDLLLEKVSSTFPQTPLVDHFRYWQVYEENHLDEAEAHAKRLCARFPQNDEFRFLLSHCLLVQNKVKPAMELLEEFPAFQRSRDPDIGSLLGFGHLLQSKDKVASASWEQARHYFHLAKKARRVNGLPTSDIDLNLLYMREKESKSPPKPFQEVDFWVMPLSARNVYELSTVDEKEIEHLFRSIGKEPRIGDYICLSSNHTKHLRSVAIYRVLHKAVWHPIEKNHAILELVERFPNPVKTSLNLRNLKGGTFKLSSSDVETLLSELEDRSPIREKLRSPLIRKPAWILKAV